MNESRSKGSEVALASGRARRGPGAAGQETAQAILAAATRLFHRQGFEATTMRQLASEVGIEAASLYNHFSSKQELLAFILHRSMDDLLAVMESALADAEPDPVARLRVAVRSYVLFHQVSLETASISDTERRSLSAEGSTKLSAQRRQLAEIFRAILKDGAAQNAFEYEDESIATLTILSICARLPVWYRPDGRLSLDQIADRLADSCLRMLGCKPSRAEGRRRNSTARLDTANVS